MRDHPMADSLSTPQPKTCKWCGREHQRADAVICSVCAIGPPPPRCSTCYMYLKDGDDAVCDKCKRTPTCKSCLSDLPLSLFPTVECIRCYDFTEQAEKCRRCSRNFLATAGCMQMCRGCWIDDFEVSLRETASDDVCICGILSEAILTC